MYQIFDVVKIFDVVYFWGSSWTMFAEIVQKSIFIFNIFISKKLYIYIYVQWKNIFMFSEGIDKQHRAVMG